MAAALVAGLIIGALLLRSDAPPELTRAELASAWQRWQQHGPASYSYELRMRGALEDHRLVVVEGGEVVDMSIDGVAVAQSSWPFWTVDALLQSMSDELDNRADPPPGLGISDGDQMVLRATFDAELGYPTRFLRHLLGRQRSTEWEIVAFEALP